jgi:hypothetical protein
MSSRRGSNNRLMSREIFAPKPTPTVEVEQVEGETITTTEITDE